VNLYLCAPALRDRLSVTTTATRDMATGLPVILQDGTYTYVYGLGMIYWVDGSGNVTYRLTDGLGSTVALCNGSGTVTDSWTYDPSTSSGQANGAVKTHSGSNATEFTLTGEQNDPNRLEYLRARYYDSATGRFISRDPLRHMNLYTYANNNPLNVSDPTGKGDPCLDYDLDSIFLTGGLLGFCFGGGFPGAMANTGAGLFQTAVVAVAAAVALHGLIDLWTARRRLKSAGERHFQRRGGQCAGYAAGSE